MNGNHANLKNHFHFKLALHENQKCYYLNSSLFIAISYLLIIPVSIVKLHSLTLLRYLLQKCTILNFDDTRCQIVISHDCTVQRKRWQNLDFFAIKMRFLSNLVSC